VHKKDKYDNDDMKVTLKDSRVHKVSKLIDEADAAFESVGLAMVSGKSYREKFKITIERMVRSKDYLDKYWLEVFNTLAREKVAIRPFQIEDGWQEFDYHHDVEEFLKYKGNGPGKTD
jgi:choline kinase